MAKYASPLAAGSRPTARNCGASEVAPTYFKSAIRSSRKFTHPLVTAALQQNLNPNIVAGLTVDVQMNARLTWTTQIAIFRTDSPIKGLIRQTEQEVELKAKAEGSEYEFDNDAWQFGIDAWRGVGYGYWQRACLLTMA